jgi:hypothetical protein
MGRDGALADRDADLLPDLDESDGAGGGGFVTVTARRSSAAAHPFPLLVIGFFPISFVVSPPSRSPENASDSRSSAAGDAAQQHAVVRRECGPVAPVLAATWGSSCIRHPAPRLATAVPLLIQVLRRRRRPIMVAGAVVISS